MNALTMTSPLDDADKAATGAALNRVLADLIDLSLVGKQAHWTLVGRGFRSLHLQLDEVVDAVRIHADDIAERAVTIGVTPDGRAATVAAESALPEHPTGWAQDTDVVDYFVSALGTVIGRLREAISATEKTDVVSQDLLIGITAALEKHLWMFQAER
jgi:starvation-inducible DNA-binding protein